MSQVGRHHPIEQYSSPHTPQRFLTAERNALPGAAAGVPGPRESAQCPPSPRVRELPPSRLLPNWPQKDLRCPKRTLCWVTPSLQPVMNKEKRLPVIWQPSAHHDLGMTNP